MDHRATRIAPTMPTAGSIQESPKYLAPSRAAMARTDVSASAITCRYADLRL